MTLCYVEYFVNKGFVFLELILILFLILSKTIKLYPWKNCGMMLTTEYLNDLILFLLIHPLSTYKCLYSDMYIYISIYVEHILYVILYCTYYNDRFNVFLSLLLGVCGGNRSPGSIPQILH